MPTSYKTLSIAKEFSRTPGPRYRSEGAFSGEEFRETVLRDKVRAAIEANENITIILDGTAGYGTSFLDEAFGGLVRVDKMKASDINKHLQFVSDEEPYLVDDIRSYISAHRLAAFSLLRSMHAEQHS